MREDFWISRAEKLSAFDGKGLSFQQVAKCVGLHQATVKRYTALFGLNIGSPAKAIKAPVVVTNGKLEIIRRLASEGKTRSEVSAATGISLQMVGKYGREHGIAFRHASAISQNQDRADAMCAMYRGGKTLAQIGELYGVTRERVRQVIKKAQGITGANGGQSALSSRRRDQARARRNAASISKHGCTYEQYRSLVEIGKEMVAAGYGVYTTPTRAYASQRQNAKFRNIEWNLTLWDWWLIWQESGKWSERGRAGDKFVMCRFADDGAYEVGSVYIATLAHNSSVQPNNPYRKDHPDHAKVVRNLSARNRAPRKKKYHGLPLGVTVQKCNGRFIAQISIAGKNKYLGTFLTPELAHEAYLRALRSAFPEGVAA